MSVHPDARDGFCRSAVAYENGRPDYPNAAVDRLAAIAPIGPATRVLDLAAGTGKLTRLLAAHSPHVIAVEPVQAMREILVASVRGVDVRAGSAEDLPLPDNAVDVVTVAQAFRWFADDDALREITRVLRPGGALALVWNRRDTSQQLQNDLDAIADRYRGETPDPSTGRWRPTLRRRPDLVPLDEGHLPHEHCVDQDALVARMLSISYLAVLPSAERVRIERSIRSLVQVQRPPVRLRYVTDLYLYRLLDVARDQHPAALR